MESPPQLDCELVLPSTYFPKNISALLTGFFPLYPVHLFVLTAYRAELRRNLDDASCAVVHKLMTAFSPNAIVHCVQGLMSCVTHTVQDTGLSS